MSDHVYKTLEITGSSQTSIEDAVRTAIHKAGESIDHIQWFEVAEVRGHVESNTVAHWQVTLKLGFRLN